MLTIGPLNDLPGVRHAFFTREGGVSEGLFSSLNCGLGSGDDTARVHENRRRAMAVLDLQPESLVTAFQVHSPEVAVVEEPWTYERRPKVDAMVTRERAVALGILTADCAPVLLADAQAGVVGAAHAGWRGALGGVIETTLSAMEELGAKRARVVAGIGPAIEQRSYEVSEEFPAPFIEAEADARDLFCPSRRRPGHFHFDLKGYVARRLRKAGIDEVQCLPSDTCGEPGRFFSYRRACLKGEADYGRGLSVIFLEP